MPDVIANKLDHLLAITSGTEQYLITCTNKKYKFLLTTTLTISVSKQLHANPKAEICAFKGGEWIRVAGELVEDDRVEVRQSMLDAYPSLQKMYAADDGNTVNVKPLA